MEYVIKSMVLTELQVKNLLDSKEQTFENVKELEKSIKEVGGESDEK